MSPDPSKPSRRPRFRFGAVLALAAAAGVGSWIIIDHRDSGTSSTTSTPAAAETKAAAPATASAKTIAPVGLSAAGLRTLTASIQQPIYWAGPKPGFLYELTRTSTGKIFVRYLPPGAQAGVKNTSFLIVATYPFKNALQALKNVSGEPQLAIPGGGIAVVDKAHPRSVHLAYPDVDNQVEVYDPSPAMSLQIAQSGAVRPVATS